MSKPVLIGMNNPHTTDPRVALFPAPAGCTGHRLWVMLNGRTGALRVEYLRVFDRRNLLSQREWCPLSAAAESVDLWDSLEGRTVLVLGQAARRVLRLPAEPELLWGTHRGVRWCSVPYPSGLNHWYNREVNREVVGLRLEDLYIRYTGSVD